MSDNANQNIKVGLLVIAGLIIFVVGLYLIGQKDNMFSAGFKISANFKDVKGLLIGNNVRFSGINIGTVKELDIVNDSMVRVVMNIQEKNRKFIRKNTVATIGTDGLIGNKIVILVANSGKSETIKNGDEIKSLTGFDTDANLKTLEDTGAEIALIAKNIREITDRLKKSDAVWDLLEDSTIGNEGRKTLNYINRIAENTMKISREFALISKDLNSGKGNLTTILKDTSLFSALQDINKFISDSREGKNILGAIVANEKMADRFQRIFMNVEAISDSVKNTTAYLNTFSKSIDKSAEHLHHFVGDSLLLDNLKKTVHHLSNSSVKLEENLEALKHSFLFKKYFKKLEKSKKKG
jgi:phospholipid/cholesterol/gamma-HCH transport system substrate-binding protein